MKNKAFDKCYSEIGITLIKEKLWIEFYLK